MEKGFWRYAIGKTCKIVYEEGGRMHVAVCKVLDANDSFLCEKDMRTGRIYFLATNKIIKLTVLPKLENQESGKRQNRCNKVRENFV